MALVMLQPDLGTTLVFGAITFGDARGRRRAGRATSARSSLVGGLGAAVVLSSGLLDDYQKDRLTAFIDQDRASSQTSSRTDAYNLEQSKIAIGSGGSVGKGLFKGPQTRLGNVPEQHTDFIFTAVGEELGFVGSATLLALLGVVVWRIWRTAQLARDDSAPRLRRRPGDVRVPGLRERRHDHGHHADHRHPAAAGHVLRRSSTHADDLRGASASC